MQEAEAGGKTKGRNIAKRVVDWVNLVEELVGLRIDEYDPLTNVELQIKYSEVGDRLHNNEIKHYMKRDKNEMKCVSEL